MKLASRAVVWLRSSEGVLGTLAIGGLVINLVLPAFGGSPAAFADLVGYAFTFAVFYEFLPRVWPARGQPFAKRGPVRVIVATTGLANTVIVTLALRETISNVVWWGVGVLLVSFVTLVLYLRFSSSFDLDDPNDPAVNAMAVIINSRVEDPYGEVWDHPIGKKVGAIGLGLTVATFGWITGVFGPLIGIAWPLPELLVLGWIVSEHAANRFESISGTWLPSREQVDVNSRFIASAAYLLRSNAVKGATVLAIMQLPAVTSALALAGGVFAVLLMAKVILAGVWDGGLWNMIMVAMLILACLTYGGYTAWFWLRELRRLPAYFAAWTAEHMPQPSQRSDDWSPPDPPTRPPDYLLVASLLSGWLVVFSIVSLARPELVRSPTPVAGLLAAAWGGLMVGIGYSVAWTWRHRPQPIKHEDRAFVLSFLIQYIGLALGTHFLLSHPQLADLSPLPGGLIGEPLLYLFFALIVLVFYFPDVGMRGYGASGVRVYAVVVYILVLAAVVSAAAVVWAEASLFLWISSAVIVLLIPLFYVANRFARDGG